MGQAIVKIQCRALVVGAVLLGFFLVTGACSRPDGPESQRGGTLRLTVNNALDGRLLAPNFDMDLDHLVITAEGPFDTVVVRTLAAGVNSLTLTELYQGAWTLTAQAYNAANVLIGSGEAEAYLLEGKSTQTNVVVRAFSGEGDLDLMVTWPEFTLEEPQIEARIVSVKTATERELAFTAVGSQSATLATTLDSGYYDLFLSVSDQNGRSLNAYYAVRILPSETTEGELALRIDPATGELIVAVDIDLENPVKVTLEGGATVSEGESLTVTASVDPAEGGGYGYTWYLNGVAVEGQTQASIELDSSDLAVGQNVLTVRVSAGSTITSAERTIERLAPAADGWTLLWSDDFEDGVVHSAYDVTNGQMTTEIGGYWELRQEATDNGPGASLLLKDLLPAGVAPAALKFQVDVWLNSVAFPKANEIGFTGTAAPSSGGLYAKLLFGDYTVGGPNSSWVFFRRTYVGPDLNAVSFSQTPIYEQWINGNTVELDLQSGAVNYANASGLTGSTTLIDPSFSMDYLNFDFGPGGWFTGHVMRIDNLSIWYKP